MDRKIYSVSELNSSIKDAIELEFGGETVWVGGEISGFKGHYASGHWYFSLKDKQSQISAVCFRGSNQQIKFTPENGMDVICAARVGVYEKDGKYQLYVSAMEPKGVGADALALEKLKQKLFEEGLFDDSKKRPLPFLSRRIGVVTSPSGAAVRDFLKVVYRRFPNVEVVISPASVQGDSAPAEITRALDRLYGMDDLDLIVVTRGGGSKEDLRAFNDEGIARKIASSPFPVISAVGHEVDMTIADLVSDVRAATPSVAAEFAVREKGEILENLAQLRLRLSRSLTNRVDMFSMQLDRLAAGFRHHMTSRIENLERRIENYSGKLTSLNPFSVLERGYAIVSKEESGEIVQDSRTLELKEKLVLRLSKGRAFCSVEGTENEPQV
ncbi:MAG: exodeoxyribonuclease VII large subunit [Candidatus Dadabacteria bacterium]|nr:exodeoxyribonuclease VII large subunit [Candidatus Dadabacteria bacterium]